MGGDASAQKTVLAPAFSGLREAAATWDDRTGPQRAVVDVVCLVPDLPTFFEAIAAWDDRHFFPILIDDVETSFRFIRAFRPSRVVRYPGRGTAGTDEDLWGRAIDAVGRAWSPDGTPARDVPRGDVIPKTLGRTPPAAVMSHPGSPSLAGAVALAAGRFQPLLRWTTAKKYADVLTADEAIKVGGGLESEIATQLGHYWKLGDDLDFLTLAGDYPLCFADEKGRYSFDDMLLRSYPSRQRWGYVGRLIGDPIESVYRAMCSLFLSPRSCLMFNGYVENGEPWSDYAVNRPAVLLGRRTKVATRSGERARIEGWHQAFDPVNRYDLLFINSSGGSRDFSTAAGTGGVTQDIPPSVPVAIHIVHSYSAETPTDPWTLAGRWLANGAFLYYGSNSEPYLQSFRTPELVASCLDLNMPMIAATRKLDFELFGQPWRLLYLGDPLYRIQPIGGVKPRVGDLPTLKNWPPYVEYRAPEPGTPEALRVNWALKAAIARLRSVPATLKVPEIAGVLLGIDRKRLDAGLVPIYDALLIDTLLDLRRTGELIERLQAIPAAERSPTVRRYLEALRFAALARAESAKDFRQAVAIWSALLGEPLQDAFRALTPRVGNLATAAQCVDWLTRLRAARRSVRDDAIGAFLDAEIQRIEKKAREG